MACKKTTVPFSGTKEQEAALKEAIAQLKDTPGSLMPIMQKAQEIYGYLPIEVQTMISDETGIPLEKVYGVSTFYAQFALQPKGKYQNFRLSRYCVLCKGFRQYFQQTGRASGHYQRRMHSGRQIFSGFLPVRRRLRSGSRYDD